VQSVCIGYRKSPQNISSLDISSPEVSALYSQFTPPDSTRLDRRIKSSRAVWIWHYW